MTTTTDRKELVWAAVNMRLNRKASYAYCFGAHPVNDDLILPASQVQCFELDRGGDKNLVHPGDLVRSVRIPRWLAEDRNLEILDDDDED